MFNSSLYILQHNYNCKIDNKLCKICEWSNDETSMKNVLNAKEKIALLTKNNSFLLALFSNKKKMNYLLDFLFQLLKQFTLIPIAPKTNKGTFESKTWLWSQVTEFLTWYAFFTPLWPHPSLLNNQHHHGLVLIKLFTKNLHDNFEKIYLRTTLIWCHTM